MFIVIDVMIYKNIPFLYIHYLRDVIIFVGKTVKSPITIS